MVGRVAFLPLPRLLRTVRSSPAILRSNDYRPACKVIRLSGFDYGATYRVTGTYYCDRVQLPRVPQDGFHDENVKRHLVDACCRVFYTGLRCTVRS